MALRTYQAETVCSHVCTCHLVTCSGISLLSKVVMVMAARWRFRATKDAVKMKKCLSLLMFRSACGHQTTGKSLIDRQQQG